MKTWKKPELLNLMLQETKDVAANTPTPLPYDNHKCNKTGQKCELGNNNVPNPDTCASNHGSLVYTTIKDHLGNDVQVLLSCCS